MKAEGSRRKGRALTVSSTLLNPTQSRAIVLPWLLLGYLDTLTCTIRTHTHTHTCLPCVRYMEEHIEVHLSFHAVSVQEKRQQTDHHTTGCYIKACFEVCLK